MKFDVIKILRECDIPQIQGSLARFRENGELIGKCAMGVISCGVGRTLTPENSDMLLSDYWTILAKAGIDIEDQARYPYIGFGTNHYVDFEMECTLSEYIWHMNDNGYTFKEIADFLETTFPGIF